MRKVSRLPHEQNADGLPVEGEGITWRAIDDDVEGHDVKTGEEGVGTRLPGTGGDYRRPTSGGEIADDVEGHASNAPDELGPRLPGTGGDYRRPTSGGEITDDVEG